MVRYHNHGAGKLIEIHMLKSEGGKFHIRAPAFLLRPEKNDAGMTAGPMSSQIGKTFVRGNQPASLNLNARPDNFIGKALPALFHDRCGVMAACGKPCRLPDEAGPHRF